MDGFVVRLNASRTKGYVGGLLTALAACLCVGCGNSGADEIQSAIIAVAGLGPGAELSLDTVAPGKWSRLYIFGPYSSERHIEQCTGLDIASRHLHSMESRDDMHLLVVLHSGDSYSTVAVRRRDAEFGASALNISHTPSSALVVMRDTEAGDRPKIVPATDAAVDCNVGDVRLDSAGIRPRVTS